MKKPQVFIFDYGEVIASGYFGIEDVIAANTKISTKDFLRKKEEANYIYLDLMRGKMTEREYYEYLMIGTDWGITPELYGQFVRQNLNRPVEGTLDIVRALKRDFRVVLLSDHVREWIDYSLVTSNILDYFPERYFSYDMGMVKGDSGTFPYVLKDLGADPSEAVFIDDLLVNLDSATSYGIDAIKFIDAKTLQKQLSVKYDIHV